MMRMVDTPRSTSICEPIPYSRESAGKPSSSFASTVSRPWSCKRIRAQLVPESDAATLVAAQVDDHAAALTRDLRERAVELEAAVAAHRPEDVTGEALAVHADQHVVLA